MQLFSTLRIQEAVPDLWQSVSTTSKNFYGISCKFKLLLTSLSNYSRILTYDTVQLTRSFLSDAIACLLRALAALVSIYFFYTIPLVWVKGVLDFLLIFARLNRLFLTTLSTLPDCRAAQALVQPENLANIIPDILTWQENSEFVANIFSGLVPALVWSGFFAWVFSTFISRRFMQSVNSSVTPYYTVSAQSSSSSLQTLEATPQVSSKQVSLWWRNQLHRW